MIFLHTVPVIIKYIIDDVIPSENYTLMIQVIAIMFGIIIFGTLLTLYYVYQSMLIREKASLDLSKMLFKRVEESSLENVNKLKTGDVITTINGDSSRTIDFSLNLINEISLNLALLIYIFIILLILDFRLLLLSLIILPFLILTQIHFGKVLHDKSVILRNSFGDYISFLEEKVRHVRLVQLFQKEKEETEEFEKKGNEIINKTINVALTSEYSFAISTFLTHLALVIVLGFSAYFVMSGELTTGTLVAFYGYQMSLYSPIKKILHSYSTMKKDIVGVERVSKLYRETEPLEKTKTPKPIPTNPKQIQFENVSLKKNEKNILKNISVQINKGQIIGITGPSGSGKSTLLNLIYRFSDPSAGEIKLNNTNIKNFEITKYRQLVALITSTPELLNDTIINNLKIANNNISKEKIEKVCKFVHIHDYIITLKKGYDTNLGSISEKLSEGQKQRISIARAILKDPLFFLFDETTSSLDAQTEKHIERLIVVLKNIGKTVVIVSHRINSLKKADNILVLKDGEIIEQGTYTELVNQNSLFKKLATLQEE